MAKPASSQGTRTCESCQALDVRRWHREGKLRSGQQFMCSWTYGDEPFGSIGVGVEMNSVLLMFNSQCSHSGVSKHVKQRVPVVWTACSLGGQRAWFRCDAYTDGVQCRRRVAMLYCAGELFACRRCLGLTYESQRETVPRRAISKAQKIRMRLGGSPNLMERFPEKPSGLHWRTYERLRKVHDAAEERFF